MAKIARILKTDVMGDLSALAQILQSKGRGKDTILAHITPAEAKRLKKAGGRGSKNPDTGLLEFDDEVPTPPAPEAPPAPAPAPAPAAGNMGEVTVNAPAEGGDYSSLGTSPAFMGTSQYGFNAPAQTAPVGVAQPQLTPAQLTAGPAPQIALPPELAQTQYDLSQTSQIPEAQPKSFLGSLNKSDLLRLGLGGVGAVMGGLGARKSAQQIAAAQQEQQALAQPYQEAGRAMTGAAARGELTPASAQAYQAAQAQMQQQAAARGGVGVEQQAAQLEAFRQKLLEQQYTYGLQVAQIGDNIAIGAIRTGLQLDQQLSASTQNFYTNLAAIVAGGFGQRQQQTQQQVGP